MIVGASAGTGARYSVGKRRTHGKPAPLRNPTFDDRQLCLYLRATLLARRNPLTAHAFYPRRCHICLLAPFAFVLVIETHS